MRSPLGVVIATRGRRKELLRTLGVLENLPERPPVVVAYNGPGDAITAAVHRSHPAVTLLALGRDKGPAARTAGVRALRTPIVAFCDDDSWWEPGALTTAVRLFDRHPRLGLLQSRILVGERGRLDPTCEGMRRSPLPSEPDLPGPPVLGFVACGAVVRRSAFLAVGGFRPGSRFGGEETLLALDLAARGWGLAYSDEPVSRHFPHEGERPGRRANELRNRLAVAWLRRPLRVALARTGAALSAARGDRELARETAQALGGLPALLLRRRPLPADLERRFRLLG